MKLSGLSIAIALFTTSAFGQNITYDYGTVVESVPIVKTYRVSTPREECWQEEITVQQPRGNNGVGTVVGALLGGAVGNAVGHKKKNKQVGVVVGAILGGTIGHAISVSNQRRNAYQVNSYRQTEEVCRTYRDYRQEEEIVGYRIRYRFNNETYTTRTDVDPGDTIKLRLVVSPVI